MENPKICLIVPMKGNADYFPACLESLAKIAYQPLDIFLVDDGMDIEALQTAQRFNSKIIVLKSDGKGPSYARNLAVKKTDAEIVAFTDSDCIVEADWLDKIKGCFDTFGDAAGCGGIQLLPEGVSDFEKNVFMFFQRGSFLAEYVRLKSDNIIEVKHNASCNAAYKRQAFLDVGGFPEDLWPGEDVELDYKLTSKGYKLYFNPFASFWPLNIKQQLFFYFLARGYA